MIIFNPISLSLWQLYNDLFVNFWKNPLLINKLSDKYHKPFTKIVEQLSPLKEEQEVRKKIKEILSFSVLTERGSIMNETNEEMVFILSFFLFLILLFVCLFTISFHYSFHLMVQSLAVRITTINVIVETIKAASIRYRWWDSRPTLREHLSIFHSSHNMACMLISHQIRFGSKKKELIKELYWDG